MSGFTCGFADHLDEFVAYRRASGTWSESSAKKLRAFDRHCAASEGTSGRLTQQLLDSWCERRDTESADSCQNRVGVARAFAVWATGRGHADVVLPELPRKQGTVRIPHHFTREELARFFEACDEEVPHCGKRQAIRRIQCAAFFRLLYSSGIRTTEARLLRRADVDFEAGVLSVRRSKGPDQHYVALHPYMAAVLREYDAAAERLQPGREYLFESSKGGGHLSTDWVCYNFARIWRSAGGRPGEAVAYDLRHQYAVENVLSWGCDPFSQHDRLTWLSKSMGHRHLASTLHYYHVTPALADKLSELTSGGMDEVIPDAWEASDGQG